MSYLKDTCILTFLTFVECFMFLFLIKKSLFLLNDLLFSLLLRETKWKTRQNETKFYSSEKNIPLTFQNNPTTTPTLTMTALERVYSVSEPYQNYSFNPLPTPRSGLHVLVSTRHRSSHRTPFFPSTSLTSHSCDQ